MSVYKDEKLKTWFFVCRYKDTSTDKLIQKKKRGFTTKKEAKQVELTFLQDIEDNNASNHRTLKLSALCTNFINYKQINVAKKTYQSFKYDIDRFIITFFGDVPVKKITPLKINEWKLWIDNLTYNKNGEKQNYSTGYKNDAIILIKSIFSFGYKHKLINDDPTTMLQKFKKTFDDYDKNNIFSLKDFDIFINEVDSFIWKLFYTTLFQTGMRKGEIRAIRWKDIKDKVIEVNKSLGQQSCVDFKFTLPKTKGSVRKIEITGRLYDLLLQHKETQRTYYGFNDEWFVFGGNRPISTTQIDRVKNNAIKSANAKGFNIPYVRIHDFRHSHASILISERVNITYVSKRLGHSNIGMTLEVYTHLINELAETEAQKIEDIF